MSRYHDTDIPRTSCKLSECHSEDVIRRGGRETINSKQVELLRVGAETWQGEASKPNPFPRSALWVPGGKAVDGPPRMNAPHTIKRTEETICYEESGSAL